MDPKLASEVSIALLDGRTRRGRLTRFSPTEPDIALDVAPPGSPPRREIVPAEHAAYVAWRRVPNERSGPVSTSRANTERYKVHVVGGKTFVVDVPVPVPPRGVGFEAYPVDRNDEHERFFFYNHGIRTREKDAPFGSLLVRTGAAPEASVERAAEEQKRSRAVPIGQILVEQRTVSSDDVERAVALQARRKLRIGEVLVEEGLAKPGDIDAALAEQKLRKGKRLGEVLVEMGIIKESVLTDTLAHKFDLQVVDLSRCSLDDAAAREVPRDLIAKYGVLPVAVDDKKLTVAISDPLALEVLDILRFQTKKPIAEVLVTPSQLRAAVAGYLERNPVPSQKPQVSLDAILQQLSTENGAQESEDDDGSSVVENSTGIISLVNEIIADACRRGASDIHVEPNGKERPTMVRFRIDGDCVKLREIPAAHRAAVVARIKVMAKLDISERRKPQDGKIKFRIGDKQIELRVATMPTTGGEDVVMRVLADSKPLPLDQLKLSARNLTELSALVQKPYGLILCVGPTGSGKTTTLHSALGSINTPDMKIWTAEDPVEITQPGLRQVQVNARIGFTFASAMRSFLRADPDVIMVGEMRDTETAETAIEASLTGHLVFSTLHTNSAPETITRLLDMGLDPYSFADAMLGVLAQRLARGLCPKCRTPRAATGRECDELAHLYGREHFASDLGFMRPEDTPVWSAPGCEACAGTGYKGRVALHELLVADDEIRRAIARKAAVSEIRAMAKAQGMRSLVQDGVAKALAGETDLSQVLAVCSADK